MLSHQVISRIRYNTGFVVSGIRAYEQLGLRAFGQPGKMIAAGIITMHNIGGTVWPFLLFIVVPVSNLS